ncbi:crossover junction endonuclease MUS81 isoform X1 [Benincasa hispida]|uniref:crossover junction endonuclease MUS81 isoform X1 n=1 Tax=Benincasa hispida TaxID=102211 RepID=UPI00190098F3|nr:crossover junction endonuclease MUS81 isoform X1 [Benincasa hispida]
MDRQRSPVVCPENEDIATFMWQKRLEMAATPKGISDKVDMTLYKAYFNVCNSKVPIKSMKDLSQIKGVGKWILKQVHDFFKNGSEGSGPEELVGKGKKTKGTKRYVPQKNSVAYALLITLYRGTTNGNEYMRKQELIDASEASGLSRVAIAPEKGKGKPSQFGSSPRDWYSGWSCMKTLISRGLVVKSNCPAKYMLTEEGQQVARECLMRSGLLSSTKNVDNTKGSSILESCDISDHSANSLDSDVEVTSPTAIKSSQNKSTDVPLESLERFMRMGYSKHQVLDSFKEVSEDNPNKDISSLWPAVLCRLREDLVYGQVEAVGRENRLTSSSSSHDRNGPKIVVNDNGERFFNLRACSSSNPSISSESCRDGVKANMNILSMPPLSFGEKFEDSYNVVLILDDREQFANHSSRSRRMIENICSQFKIQIEIRRLPVGDGIWIARHKHLDNEYVLDFIVERKNIDDLRCSIRDNRYRDQKLKLLRCGLKRMIYLVEGDPNSSEAAESIKTACFTTEILEGFDVQRTSGLSDTLKKYGYLTRAITQYYILQASDERLSHSDVCPRLNEFIKKCQELDKMTVSDVFALQLMQVPQVTEEVAVAVLELYPTLLSLARAYSLLDGNVTEQEEMLRRQSNNLINAGASRNIFHLVWGCGK